jgi:hypothetical protein
MKTLKKIAPLFLAILIFGSSSLAENSEIAIDVSPVKRPLSSRLLTIPKQDPPTASATHWDKWSPKCGATFDACPSNSECTKRLEMTCAPPECPGECRPKTESGKLACKRMIMGPGSRACPSGYYCRGVGAIGGDSGGECVEGTCPAGLPSRCLQY